VLVKAANPGGSLVPEDYQLRAEQYGKPLGGALQGLRRIRTGDVRVAYQVQPGRVVIWAVKHRKDIYRELERRLGAGPSKSGSPG